MLNNPYGCHSQALTGPAKNTMLAQRNGRILKLVSPLTLDRNFLEQWRTNNPDGLIIYRHYFGDNNLGDPEGRASAIIKAVIPVADIVDVCETGYNECNEGINDGIRDLAQAEMRVANRIRAGLHGMKVAGGCFSVGTPYNDVTKGEFQDIEAYAAAFSQLDYWAPHEYGSPSLIYGIKSLLMPDGSGSFGRDYGAFVLRYRYVVDWAKRAGVKLPPIILGEFGLDWGGAGNGFRSRKVDVGNYMNQAKEIAPAFMADIAAGILAGVVFFCVGQDDPDSWASFDLAGESAFQSLLSAQFGDVSAQAEPSATVTPKAQDGPHGVSVGKPPTLWYEWFNTDGNEWVNAPNNMQAEAFVKHAHEAGGVKKFNPSVLKDLGVPEWFWSYWNEGINQSIDCVDSSGNYIEPSQELAPLPEIAPKPIKLELMERITAKRLGVPVERVRAVYQVESNGKPFSAKGRATIRFEAHDWLPAVPDDKKEWAKWFRVGNGIEQVNDDGKGNWVSLQNKDQAGRWADLTLAVQISGDLAFQWTSMGLFQILGLHHDDLHYGSAGDMLQAFSHHEGAQWRGFEDFVLADERLHRAMIDGDAERFSLLYNGNAKLYAPLLWRAGWK